MESEPMKKAPIIVFLLIALGMTGWATSDTRRHPADGFSFTPAPYEADEDLGYKAILREILRIMRQMRDVQAQILLHEENMDKNMQRIADKIAK